MLKPDGAGNLPLLVARPNQRLLPSDADSEGLMVRKEPTFTPAQPSQPSELVQLASHRSLVKATEQLLNIRAIQRIAEEEAERMPERPLPDERPAPEWLAAWREGAEQVEEDQVRLLWARILCGETQEPGSYSKRTLHALRVLDHKEASIFARIGPRIIGGKLFKIEDLPEPLDNVRFGDLLLLEDAGLITGVTGGLVSNMHTVKESDNTQLYVVRTPLTRGWRIGMSFSAPRAIELDCYSLTSTGTDLLKIADFAPDLDFLKEFARIVRKTDPETVSEIAAFRVSDMLHDGTYHVLERLDL